jgi:hypothetical protein
LYLRWTAWSDSSQLYAITLASLFSVGQRFDYPIFLQHIHNIQDFRGNVFTQSGLMEDVNDAQEVGIGERQMVEEQSLRVSQADLALFALTPIPNPECYMADEFTTPRQ